MPDPITPERPELAELIASDANPDSGARAAVEGKG
jgi:hypothetical protein